MPTLAEVIALPWTAQQYRALTAAIVDDEWGEHDLCSLTACRLPLHPGPCKGWKHTLHLTAPGVYHTLERERVAKANQRRVAKIAQLQAQGKPVPAALRKPITYSPPAAAPAAKMGQHAEVVGGTSHQASQAANASAGVVQKTAPSPHPHASATAGTDSAAKAAKAQTVAQAAQGATPQLPTIGHGMVLAKNLQAGDRIKYANTPVTILSGPTPGKDKFGQPMLEYQARREDTGKVGKIIFGPTGQAEKLPPASPGVTPTAPGTVSHGVATKPAPSLGPAQLTNPVGVPGSRRGPDQAHIANILADPQTSDLTKATILAGLTETEFTTNFDAQHQQMVVDKLHELSTHSDPVTAKRASAGLAKISKYKGAPKPSAATSAPAAPPATPSAPAAPSVSPSAPLPATASAAAKLAHATANRTASRSLLAKTQVENYAGLSKADFDQLPDATRAQIRSDLRVAKQKFLDPKKQKQADDLLTRFGGAPNAPAAPSAPAAPAAPAPARAVSVPSLSWSGDRRLTAYEKMTKADFDTLPDAARARITRDLDALSKHGSPLDAHGQQRANAAHTRLRGAPSAPAAAPAVVQTPAPAVGNQRVAALAQAIQTGGHASVLDAVENATHRDITGGLSIQERKGLDRKLAVIEAGSAASPADKARAKELRNAINSPIPSHLDDNSTLADIAAAHNKGAMQGQIHAGQAVAKKGYSSPAADLAQHAYVGDNVDFLASLDAANRDHLRELDAKDFVAVTQRVEEISRTGKPDEQDAAKALLDALQAKGHPTTKAFGDIADELEAARNAPAKPAKPAVLADLDAEVEKAIKSGDHGALLSWIASERVKRAGTPERVTLNEGLDKLITDKRLPAWVRSQILMSGGHDLPSQKNAPYNSVDWLSAISASQARNRDVWSTYQVGDLFAVKEDEIARMHPVHAQSVREAREDALASIVKRNLGNFGVVKSDLNAILSTGASAAPGSALSVRGKETYDSLTPAGKQHVLTMLDTAAGNGSSNYGTPQEKARFQRIHDELTGKKYNTAQQTAINQASAQTRTIDAATLADLSDMTKSEYQGLPKVYRDAIDEHMMLLQAAMIQRGIVPPNTEAPLITMARWQGTLPQYSLQDQIDAAAYATLGKDWYSAEERFKVYRKLDGADFGGLKAADQTAVKNEAAMLGGSASPLEDFQRHNMEIRRLEWDGTWQGYTPEQRHAAVIVVPGYGKFVDQTVIDGLNDLDKAGYDGLTPSMRQMVDKRISELPGPDSVSLHAKFHPAAPAYTPRSAPSLGYGMTTSSDVKINAALDIIYGRHAKADHVSAQISAYGALRKDQFDKLNPAEQSQVLGDLSYIATTSKGSNQVKAKAFIDRFTPAGTPMGGNAPGQAPAIPVVAVAGQTRLPTPQAGLLKEATDKGQPGDGWFTQPDGKRLWGQYGAAGLLLAHDGPDGKRRYLMVQRGPAISDPGKWQFPGGAIDSKESAYQGGTREVIEELGFKPGALDSAVVHGYHESAVGGGTWKYTSVAAVVPDQLKPDLSTHHARQETSDAKWMTIDEIRALDTGGKLLAPLAGGKLEQNVVSLFPPKTAGTLAQQVQPRTTKLKRLRVPTPTAHKPSLGRDLVTDKTERNKLRQDVKKTRAQYDGKTADGRLAAIAAIQGYDDVPTVLSRSEIDKLLATGDYIEAWRGVRGTYGGKSAKQINEEMRSGPAYFGTGIFGNGYYLATQRSVATGYSDYSDGSVMRILIPKTAITQTHDKVLRAATAASSSTSKSTSPSGRHEDGTLWDEGRYAAAKGLDGIEIPPGMRGRSYGSGSGHVAKPGKPAYNWVNRSVLIIQREPG